MDGSIAGSLLVDNTAVAFSEIRQHVGFVEQYGDSHAYLTFCLYFFLLFLSAIYACAQMFLWRTSLSMRCCFTQPILRARSIFHPASNAVEWSSSPTDLVLIHVAILGYQLLVNDAFQVSLAHLSLHTPHCNRDLERICFCVHHDLHVTACLSSAKARKDYVSR